MLKPSFALTIGSLSSSTESAVGGPRRMEVARDMDIPADALRVHLMERGGVAVGDDVELQMGHDGDLELVFVGAVAVVRPALAGAQIVALGRMQKLLDLRSAAWYDGQSAGGIARDLIDQAGLDEGTVDDGPTLPRYAVDRRQSAFGHLKELADRLGFELYAARDGSIQFRALGAAANLDAAGGLLGAAAGAVTSLLGGGAGDRFGEHLVEGSARRRAPAWGSITVGGESPMSGQGDSTVHWLTVDDADYRGESGDGDPSWLVFDAAARTKDLADRFAAGLLATAARTAHQVTIRVLGRPTADLGDPLQVAAVPDDLINGSGYVRAVRHLFGPEHGFVTDLRLALEAA